MSCFQRGVSRVLIWWDFESSFFNTWVRIVANHEPSDWSIPPASYPPPYRKSRMGGLMVTLVHGFYHGLRAFCKKWRAFYSGYFILNSPLLVTFLLWCLWGWVVWIAGALNGCEKSSHSEIVLCEWRSEQGTYKQNERSSKWLPEEKTIFL